MATDKIRTSTQVYIDDPVDFNGERAINLGDPTSPQDAITLAFAKALIAKTPATIASGTYLLSGAVAMLVTGYQYSISAASYYINKVLCSSAVQTITLDAADSTHDRFDAIVLDATGTVQKITGTPAEVPAQPTVDPALYLEVTYVYVAVNTSTPVIATPADPVAIKIVEGSNCNSFVRPSFVSLVGTKIGTPQGLQDDTTMLVMSNNFLGSNLSYISITQLYFGVNGVIWKRKYNSQFGFYNWVPIEGTYIVGQQWTLLQSVESKFIVTDTIMSIGRPTGIPVPITGQTFKYRGIRICETPDSTLGSWLLIGDNGKNYVVNEGVATEIITDISGKENTGVAAALIANLKDSVPTAGDTLKKLYNLISGSAQEIQVATIAARDAYNISSLPCNVFVSDDGDGKWALYKATTTGVGATFIKLSDPDLLNAVMSGSQIAATYESVSDVNRFTNALKAKLDSITEIFTTALKSAYDGAVTWISTNGTSLISHLSDSVSHITSNERIAWNAKEDNAKKGTYTNTTDTIEPDFAYQMVITANTGTAAIALTSFNNMPTYQCERLLIVKNNRATALAITPRTADLVVGAITYNFTNMDSATITIPAGKSAEISFLFTMTLTSNIEVRIKNSIQA